MRYKILPSIINVLRSEPRKKKIFISAALGTNIISGLIKFDNKSEIIYSPVRIRQSNITLANIAEIKGTPVRVFAQSKAFSSNAEFKTQMLVVFFLAL